MKTVLKILSKGPEGRDAWAKFEGFTTLLKLVDSLRNSFLPPLREEENEKSDVEKQAVKKQKRKIQNHTNWIVLELVLKCMRVVCSESPKNRSCMWKGRRWKQVLVIGE